MTQVCKCASIGCMSKLSLSKTEKELIDMMRDHKKRWAFMDKPCRIVILGGDGEILAEGDTTKTTREFCHDMLNNITIEVSAKIIPE